MKTFFAKYSGLTHTFAGIWAFLVGAYAANAYGFRDIVNGDAVAIYHSLPANLAKIVTAVVALAGPLWAFYRNGQKATTITAEVLPGETGTASATAKAQIAPSIVVALLCGSLLMSTTLGLTGCTASQVEKDINVVLNEATNVLAVADPSLPWFGDLKTAVAAYETAEAAWTNGAGAVADVDNALNTIVAITAAIPLTSAYSPLIDILVAGIETLLSLLPPPAVSPSVTLTAINVTSLTPAGNPHIGRAVIKHHFYRTQIGDFKAAWNAAAKKNLKTAGAVLK